MKKSLFVGSFNPITIAHEKISKELIENKIVDYLYFLPVNSNKTDLINIDNRIEMINLIKSEKEEVLNIYNYSKDGFFNYDVLEKINLNITHIILGSDLFLKFKTFNNYLDILNKYYLIVINREFDTNKYIEKEYKDYKDKIIVINKQYDGSSKKAKELLKNKDNNIYLNNKVLDYINKNNLYS